MKKRYFTLTEGHIQLIRNITDWHDLCVPESIVEVVEMDLKLERYYLKKHQGKNHISKEQMEKLENLHKEIKTASEIILATRSSEPGEYVYTGHDTN